jgi:hypothetical protein
LLIGVTVAHGVGSAGPGAGAGFGFFVACTIIAAVIATSPEQQGAGMKAKIRGRFDQLWYLAFYSVSSSKPPDSSTELKLMSPLRVINSAAISTSSSAQAKIGKSLPSCLCYCDMYPVRSLLSSSALRFQSFTLCDMIL